MQIANPIYDSVFKYMMSDSKVAKMLLSTIIGEKIVELEFSATDLSLKGNPKVKRNKTLEFITVCRVDFKAKIETETGYKTVNIELQKAKLATDIMRFRRYLGAIYSDKENTHDEKKRKARQIYCIYFLNYEVGLSDDPLINVDYVATSCATGKPLEGKSEFIDSLHHKSWIIQVRQLKGRRRNDAENLLSVFDQDNLTKDRHILNIDEDDLKDEYRFIIRKLREAYETAEVREKMLLEDDYFDELEEMEKTIEEDKKIMAEDKKTIAKKNKSLEEKDKKLKEKDKSLKEKDKSLEEKDKSLEEKDKSLEEKDKKLEEKDKSLEEKDKRIAELEKLLKQK